MPDHVPFRLRAQALWRSSVLTLWVLAGSAAHAVGTRTSARVQVAATLLKLALVAVFIVAAWLLPGWRSSCPLP